MYKKPMPAVDSVVEFYYDLLQIPVFCASATHVFLFMHTPLRLSKTGVFATP